MAFKDALAKLRQNRGLTQQELAEQVYVTRQAVSRWETGETVPGIDMVKLLAVTLDAPVSQLLEMPLPANELQSNPPSSASSVRNADASAAMTMDETIEACAPYIAQYGGMSIDEAVSFMGALLPSMSRWRAVQENENTYGAEARERFGDDVIDASNRKIMAMSEREWGDLGKLEEAIKHKLACLAPDGDPASPEAKELAAMHAAWIKGHWPDGAYNVQAHLGLARGYLADERFRAYYDAAAGDGATEFLVKVLETNLA